MKRLKDHEVYYEDRLVIRWRNPKRGGCIFSQGKRQPDALYERYPDLKDLIKAYVQSGAVGFVKRYRTQTGCSIKEAMDLLNCLRYRRKDG
jgi:hypothetical protein